MSVYRYPIVGLPTQRESGDDSDSLLKNIHVEAQMENMGDQSGTTYAVKRWGLLANDTTAVAEGRGIYVWNGDVYAVVGNGVYKNGSVLGVTLDTSTGRVFLDEAADGTGLLVISDNLFLYTVNSAGLVTKLTDVDIPAAFVDGMVVLDQYCFVMDADGFIYNSNVGDVTSWTAADEVNSEVKSDPGVALARYVNYIVAFGEDTIDMFYDAANATGSPLTRFEGMVSLVGCAAGKSVANVNQHMYFIARSPKGGGRFVAGLKGGFQIERVSTLSIEEVLDAEGADIVDAYGYHLYQGGKNLYILTIPTTAAKTYALDIDSGIWSEWTSEDTAVETYFTGIDAADDDGTLLVLDEDNGQIYSLEPKTYQDDGEPINVEIRTKKFDHDTLQNKFLHRLQPVGDTQATGTLSIEWTDDDYATYSTARTLSLANLQTWLTRCGMYKRRAFRLKHTANSPLRLSHLEGNIRIGHYARS